MGKKKKWKKPEIRTTYPEPISEEDLKLMSDVVRKRRAEWASSGLAVFAVRTGMQGEEVQTIVKDFITDLFHLSDTSKFNLESIIDQARDAYEGEKGIDDIEEGYLVMEIEKVRGEGPHLRGISPEVYDEAKPPVRGG